MMNVSRKRITGAMIVFLLLALLLSACSASHSQNKSMEEPASESQVRDEMSYGESDAAAPQMPDREGMVQATPAPEMVDGKQLSSTSREVQNQNNKRIVTAQMQSQTKDFEGDLSRLNAALLDVGGFIESQNIDTSRELHFARITVRVPVDQYEAFVQAARKIGVLRDYSESVEDITEAYYDAQARLETYKQQRARLEELAKKANTINEILTLESEISNVQYQIEAIETQQQRWDRLAAMSTVNISLEEVKELKIAVSGTPSAGEQIRTGWVNSVNTLTSVFQGLVVFLAGALPVLLIIAIPALAVWLIVRQTKKKRKQLQVNG